MNCPYCNTPNREGAKMCKACGRPLSPTPAAPPAPAAPAAVPPPAPGQPSVMKRIQWKLLGAGCFLLLLGFTCGAVSLYAGQWVVGTYFAGATPTAVVQSSTPAANAAPKPEKGSKPSVITLQDLGGTAQEFPKLAEGKPAVLVFWAADATMDGPLAVLNKRAGEKDLVVVGVNSVDPEPKISSYLKDNHLDKMVVLVAANEKVKNDYQVRDNATYFLISKDGVIVDRFSGVKQDELDRRVSELLK